MRRVPGEHHLADHLTKGKSWREIDDSIREVGGRMRVSQGNEGERTWAEEVTGRRRPHLRTMRDVGP